jgi:hypothetical protein
VTFFSCLIDGLDENSRRDAEKFFEVAVGVKEVHFIDSFARPGFFKTIGEGFDARARAGPTAKDGPAEGGVKVVDCSYTFRGHEDRDFLARVQGEELAGLIGKGLVGVNFSFIPEVQDELAEAEDGKEAGEKIAEGVLPFASDGRAPVAIKKRFETLSGGGLGGLKVLGLGMYTLTPAEVVEVVYACAGGGESVLVDLTVSVLLGENWFDTLVKGFQNEGVGKALEGIEVVGVPVAAKEEGEDWKHGMTLVTKEELDKLSVACPKLARFEMSILKVKSGPNVLFVKEGGGAWMEKKI